MKKKGHFQNILCLMFVLAIPLYSEVVTYQSLLDANFSTFIAQVVPQEDQPDFREFCESLAYSHKKTKKGKERDRAQKEIERICQQGKTSFGVRNQILANQLKYGQLGASNESKARVLFYRYGLYEEYIKAKLSRQNSILGKTKSYLKDAGSKVAGWFGNLRRGKAA